MPVVKKPISVPTYKSIEDWSACFLMIPKMPKFNSRVKIAIYPSNNYKSDKLAFAELYFKTSAVG